MNLNLLNHLGIGTLITRNFDWDAVLRVWSYDHGYCVVQPTYHSWLDLAFWATHTWPIALKWGYYTYNFLRGYFFVLFIFHHSTLGWLRYWSEIVPFNASVGLCCGQTFFHIFNEKLKTGFLSRDLCMHGCCFFRSFRLKNARFNLCPCPIQKGIFS